MEFKYEFDKCFMVMQFDDELLHKESTIKYL